MQVPQEEDEEKAVTKKAIKELEILISQIFKAFFYLFIFFNYFTLSLFSLHFLPTTFTLTHTHDPRLLATLFTILSFT